MTREEYLKIHKELTEKAHAIAIKKSHDYGGEKDILSNFKAYKIVKVEPAQGILTRLVDKLSRLANFVESGVLEVEDENIIDTICDGINYLVLEYCTIKEKQDEREQGERIRPSNDS